MYAYGQTPIKTLSAAGTVTGDFTAIKAMNADVVIDVITSYGDTLTGITLREGDEWKIAVKSVTFVSGTGVLIIYQRS